MPMPLDRHHIPLTDLALAGAVIAIELLDMYVFAGVDHHDALDAGLLVASGLVLVARRRAPLSCAVAAGALTTILAARQAPHIGLGAIAAAYALAAHGSRPGRAVGAALLLVGVWLVPLLTDDADSIPRNIALFGAAWLLGALMRDRRVRHAQLVEQTAELLRERQEKLTLAAAAERARLAQEVHDVLTHSVSVMVVQAQGAQAVQRDPERVRLALQRIERTGRTALDELRILLRDDADADDAPRAPQPDLAAIDELARATREAGVEVAVSLELPDPALPASVQLSAYRIVQEALTNVLRHSGAASASVAVRSRGRLLEVEVVDHGAGAGGPSSEGRGITGMRERATSSGGELQTGPLPGGGFRVLARLPLSP